jgi:hypothetical protein
MAERLASARGRVAGDGSQTQRREVWPVTRPYRGGEVVATAAILLGAAIGFATESPMPAPSNADPIAMKLRES